MTSSESLKFYHFLGSAPSRAVLALLNIGNIPHEVIIKNVLKGETRTPDYLKIFPLGHLPAISIGDFHLAETSAILAFLCDKYPNSIPESWYPKCIKQRAKVNEALSWNAAEFRPTVNEPFLLRVKHMFLGEPFNAAQLESTDKKIANILVTLDNILAHNGGFIAGKTMTVADLAVYFELCFLMVLKKDWSKHTNVDNWFKKMYAVPQVKQITHQWTPLIEQIGKLLDKIKPTDAKL